MCCKIFIIFILVISNLLFTFAPRYVLTLLENNLVILYEKSYTTNILLAVRTTIFI